MSDADLRQLVSASFDGRPVISLDREPYRYATSFTLEELHVVFADGSDVTLLLKDLSWERLLGDARWSKPAFLYEPRREIQTHTRLLAPEGIGPRCYGAVAEPATPRYWLLLEKVAGVELWQVGELHVWEAVARWLAGFHARFAGHLTDARTANPFLLELDGDWFRVWCERARAALAGRDDPRAATLAGALDGYADVVDALAALPTTLVHGELYPSNVMVVTGDDGLRVCPIDWEMAATGPALLDLAALVGGWDAAAQERLAAAYGTTTGADLDRCRLHLALQWLGWAPTWQAPPEHAHDWIGEALALTERLGL